MTAPIRKVILVEDDTALRTALTQSLELADFEVRSFASARACLGILTSAFEGIVVSDIRMPRMDGFELLELVRAIDADLPVVLMTGHGDVPMAVAAVRGGAYDFLTKPFETERLLATVARACEHRTLTLENRALRAAASASHDTGPMLGSCPAIVVLREDIRRLAGADVDVLIEGESGTGKDLAAVMLHRQGRRRDRAMVVVDCAGLLEETARIELFGHAANAMPQAGHARTGQVASADGGTLILDGVDALSAPVQAMLLHLLEEREMRPLGAERASALNLRVVATSARPLAELVNVGAFRKDLFHRLALTRVLMPPLRERGSDVLALFYHFLAEARAIGMRGSQERQPDPAERLHVMRYGWPGNVRELRNYAYQVVLGIRNEGGTREGGDLRSRVGAFEASLIEDALRETNGNVARAIQTLGIPRKTFYEKASRYGIEPAAFR